MLRMFTVFGVILSLLGCTTQYRIDAPASAPALSKELAVGDHVRVLARNGTIYAIEITGIEPTALIGYDAASHKNWKIPYNQIVRIDYQRVSLVTKAGAVAGGIVVTWYVILVISIAYALSRIN